MWQNLLKEDVEPDMLSHGNVIKTVVGDRLYSKITKFTSASELNSFLKQRAFSEQVYASYKKRPLPNDRLTPVKRRTYTEADAEQIRSLKPEGKKKKKTAKEKREEEKRRKLIDTLTEQVKKPNLEGLLESNEVKKSSDFKDFLRTKYGRVKETETRLVNILKGISDSPKGITTSTLLKDIREQFAAFYSEQPSRRGVKRLEAEEIAKEVPEKLLNLSEELSKSIENLDSDDQSTDEEQDLFIKILEGQPLLKLELIKILMENDDSQLNKNSDIFDYTLDPSGGLRFVKRPNEITPESRGYKEYFQNIKKILFVIKDSEKAILRLTRFASRAYGVKTKIPIDIQGISGRGKQRLAQERERSKRISRNITRFQTSIVKIKTLAESNPGSYPITDKRLRKEYEKVKEEMRKALSEILIKIKYAGKEGSELSEEDKKRIQRNLQRENIRPDTFTSSELKEKNREIESITQNDELRYLLISDPQYAKVVEEYESTLDKIVEDRKMKMTDIFNLIDKLSDDLSGLGRKFKVGMTEEISEIVEGYTVEFLDSLKSQLSRVKEEVSEVVDSLTDEKFKEEDKMEELLEELLKDKIEDPDFDVEDTRLLLKISEELQTQIKILEKTLDFIRKEVAKRPEA